MTAWEEQIERAQGEFLERFADLGFTVRSPARVHGEVQVPGYDLPIPLDIEIPRAFPYEKPKVRPTDGSGGNSWHREPDYSLCLWADEETGDLPWLDPIRVIERTREWFEKDLQGWPDDPPDLDLERYWPRTEGLVIYEEITSFAGREVALRREAHGVLRLRPVLRGGRGKKNLHAVVLEAGELAAPLRTVEDILDCCSDQRAKLQWDLAHGRTRAVVITYSRAGLSGLLALRVTKPDPLEFAAMSAAHCGPDTLLLRSGADSSCLNDRSLAVVGLGAIGSVAADLLARAGIGHMTFVDGDVIRPGNCVRHLVDQRYIGQFKVDAVREWLVGRGPMCGSDVEARRQRLTCPDEAAHLLNSHDLVLDATANQLATALLLSAGQVLQRPVVSVCLQNDMPRVDRVPLGEGEAHAPPTQSVSRAPQELYEGGCGEPVSGAPMWAVAGAASDAVAMVCDLLSGRAEFPPSLLTQFSAPRKADVGRTSSCA